MNFNETKQFKKNFKKLYKKYKSLKDDFKTFQKVITKFPLGNTDKHFHVLIESNQKKIIKARLFCRYLKGSSLRIIYAYDKNNNLIEFIELYYKGVQENHSATLIEEYLKDETA